MARLTDRVKGHRDAGTGSVASATRERKFSITKPLGGFRNTDCTYLRASDRHPIVELCPGSKAIHPKGGDLRNANFTADRLILLTVDGVLNESAYFDLTSCRPLLHPVLRNEQGGSRIFQWGEH